ncbi:uncharacterized protein OCT59_025558 [Rhizophagus irregularis]|uniref:uncharacterized protein n=1 Tax=Rhizophagus irregularis TaxID=588596 RepID=UPI000CB25274|nr:hypothetical protein OCT59_025558 [Rhizophagus irregularis]
MNQFQYKIFNNKKKFIILELSNFIYKVVELATYTSDFATDAINILTENKLNTVDHSTRQNYGYNDIDDNDDENAYDHKKKDVSTWDENVETFEDEEPPPPYDNSTKTKPSLIISISPSQQDYPTTQTETKPSFTISTSLSQQDYPTTQSIPTNSPTNSTSRQRQFRVCCGCRFVRHKSSSKMTEAEAASNSKVEVTEIEMILAKEKEHEE